MYYELNEKELELIKKIEKETMTNYEIKGNMIEVEAMMSALEDLYIELDHVQEELNDLETYCEDNYNFRKYDYE